jgi:UDP-N-acetylmuramate: L-alanyl-gamma-D-glutamyl-meso-diaminopimelate ligase
MKHIHFIGICGVGMSALAILWKKKAPAASGGTSWKVTGSDSGFYPPVSTHLEQNKIDYYPGWHPENIGSNQKDPSAASSVLYQDDKNSPFGHRPDLVVVGNVAASENPEWLYVQKNKIPYVSYPELIAQNLVRKNSIVCAGTWGKTSTTALLAYILKTAGYKPAYMFGGLPARSEAKAGLHLDQMPNAADDEGGDWSVLEGDEYKTGKDNPEAKFFSYKPTHLLLTGLAWDHFDMYPTEESYYDAFTRLLGAMPQTGLVVACADDKNIERVLGAAKCKILKYGAGLFDYQYGNVAMNKNGIQLKISYDGAEYDIYSPLLGGYMAENICGAFAMASEIGVPVEKIADAIAGFKGIKRRLEKRGVTAQGAPVYDDIAHSPVKAISALSTLRAIYAGKIFAVFEPNTGNRQMTAAPSYDNCFTAADEVIIPRLTKIKIDEKTKDAVMDGAKLAEIIARTHSAVKLMADDDELIRYLKTAAGPDDAIVFLGSHGFRGMIENLTETVISPRQ